MKDNSGSFSWLRLLGRNGWVWDSEKSIDEDYSFYGAQILGNGYYVQCWARVSTNDKGYNASGDFGVAWIECDVSTYTSCEFLGRDDAKEILSAIDHAETNLLACGIPFHGWIQVFRKMGAQQDAAERSHSPQTGVTDEEGGVRRLRMDTCRGCGQPIIWVRTAGGKSMPCDPDEVMYWRKARGSQKVVTPNGQVVSAELSGEMRDATGIGYISHFATCTKSDAFRRR